MTTKRIARTLLAALMLAAPAAAHDIPADVTLHVFVKPEAGHLRVIVRVPLVAMRDIEFPLQGDGFLDLSRADPLLRDAAMLWIADNLELYEGAARLAAPSLNRTTVSLPSDRSFESFDAALAHVQGAPLPADTRIPWNQAMLDAVFEYSIRSDRSEFAIRPLLARLGSRVVTVLRFVPPDGTVRAFEYTGDPGLVRLDPRWHQAALNFVKLGFAHILSGTDHLLFLLCLVIPFRRIRPLIVVVTAFTVAHSITLIASAYNVGPDGLWFPPLVETLIAISILYMALENIVVITGGTPRGGSAADPLPLLRDVDSRGLRRRWALAFGFGLVHGFGFSFGLRETLQFAGSQVLASLVAFNVGIELGQLLVIAILVPVLHLLFTRVVAERLGTIMLSALVGHTAWHWMVERADRLRLYAWPSLDPFQLRLVWVALAAGLAWILWGVWSRASQRAPPPVTLDQPAQEKT